MLGAGTTVGLRDALRNPPTGARITGRAMLLAGTYLYVVVGQQSSGSANSPGKLRNMPCGSASLDDELCLACKVSLSLCMYTVLC